MMRVLYLKIIGISAFVFLSGLSVFMGFLIANLRVHQTRELVAFLAASVVAFLGLHYISLTAFGFIDSENKLVRISPALRNLPFIIVIALLSVIGMKYFANYKWRLASSPVSYDARLEIMNSMEISLMEKLSKLKMDVGDRNEQKLLVTFNGNSFTNRSKNGVDLTEYYEQFTLHPGVIAQLNSSYIKGIGNNKQLSLANGQRLTVNVADSILGYLPSRNVFVVMTTQTDQTVHFESINRTDGKRLPGVPLVSNGSMNWFADLNFQYKPTTADFKVFIWKRTNGVYDLRHQETIPLGVYHTTTTRSMIKNIRWRTDSLMFDLVAKDRGKLKEVEFIFSEH